MDDNRVFIRSRWGTNRYVYNVRNPVGLALTIGSLLAAAGFVFWMGHPDLFKGGWSGDELRSGVRGATAELSRDKLLGPGSIGYEDVIAQKITEHGPGPADAVTVTATSSALPADMGKGGPEDADYTVTARGTDTAFCLHVDALRKPEAAGYAGVTFKVADGACRAGAD